MESVKNAANAVSDKISETTASASKEGNKSVAKDDNASLSTRATAAKDAAGDKATEEKVSHYPLQRRASLLDTQSLTPTPLFSLSISPRPKVNSLFILSLIMSLLLTMH
jgi:hypothetical protein